MAETTTHRTRSPDAHNELASRVPVGLKHLLAVAPDDHGVVGRRQWVCTAGGAGRGVVVWLVCDDNVTMCGVR